MSTGFAFKQRLHLYSVSNLRIFLVFQLRTFKVGFSGPKTFRGFRETGPRTESARAREISGSWRMDRSGVKSSLRKAFIFLSIENTIDVE